MTPILDDLLNDARLARLFSDDGRHCALQLWILQIKGGQTIENRVVYGRLLPYNHSSNQWAASDDDEFKTIGHAQVQAQVTRLNLYVKSVLCADLLKQLSSGRTISAISNELKLQLSDQLQARFGAATLATHLAYRPVAYLFNRDAHDRRSPSSPHGGAGAFSASITQVEKGALFRLGQDYDCALTESVINQLNADTGLDFGGIDATRFGDLELLVFPALDDQDRDLLSVNWTDTPHALVARFNPMQVPQFSGFQFHLGIESDNQLVYSGIATAERNSEGVFEYSFKLGEKIQAMADSAELEVFGFLGEQSHTGILCCRWRNYYIREVHLQGHGLGHSAGQVKFDWLEKAATRPATSARLKSVLTPSRGNQGFTNQIGGREADPWVSTNRDVVSLLARLHPPKSEGQFFLRWGQGDGEGRLQFAEWFKALLTKHQKHQVVIFDPHFETAGLGLVLLSAAPGADYIVFRSLPPKKGHTMAEGSDEPSPTGIDNLLASCELNRGQMQHFKLRIYGLKYGRLHDRYILIMGPDRLPVAGFHLSNSLQTTAQNYPLLITPIPPDVLLKVEQYQYELVREVKALQPYFDSKELPMAPRRYEPLSFLDMAQAGDVLSVLAGEPLLQGLSGNPLKEKMAALDLLKDESLALPETASLGNYLNQQASSFEHFTENWKLLGEVLAHSHMGDCNFQEFGSKPSFLVFLAQFIEISFNRAHDELNKELVTMDAQLFRTPIETLLYSSYHPERLCHVTKYTVLTWAEYFAIKFFWLNAPNALLRIAETQMSKVPEEPQGQDAVRLSLLSQIVSEIGLSVQFNILEVQRDCLLLSSNGLLQWMGLNALEMQLEKSGGLDTVLQRLATFAYPERVRALGWMVNHAASDPSRAEVYNGLVVALHEALPATIPKAELKHLIDSMRGHMQQLSRTEPWLFQDVVFPLLQNERANTDDACGIWVHELVAWLEPKLKNPILLFDRMREGQTTNITAFLFAYSSPERQQTSLKCMQAILKRQRQIVQQPLASTSNWARWDNALKISMLILAFTRWAQYYMQERGVTDRLEELSQQARDLAMVRPMNEWRLEGYGKQGELAGFLDQVEELLALQGK